MEASAMNTASEQIWHDYHAHLKRFISARVNNEAEAEDLLQEVFLRIHRRIDTLDESDRLQGWIYRIARNAIIDHYRRHRPTVALPDNLLAPETADVDVHRELEGCMEPMIAALPEPYRRALQLTELNGLTQKGLAEQEGLSLSGAKSRVQRGRAMVKEMMLDCCHFEFGHQGQIVDFAGKESCCGPKCDCCN